MLEVELDRGLPLGALRLLACVAMGTFDDSLSDVSNFPIAILVSLEHFKIFYELKL